MTRNDKFVRETIERTAPRTLKSRVSFRDRGYIFITSNLAEMWGFLLLVIYNCLNTYAFCNAVRG